MKHIYVIAMRALRAGASAVGLLALLERHRANTLCLYARSLFAIYDVQDMARLDTPWWTFPAIRRVETFLNARHGAAEVFEYGSGASTLWLARRARHVTYVEHDACFARVVKRLTGSAANVTGMVVPPAPTRPGEANVCRSGRRGYRNLDFGEYVRSIRKARGPFDLIVVDGRARVACLNEATRHLKPGGLILFDNSSRMRYQHGIAAAPLQAVRHRGFAPALPYRDETTIFGTPGEAEGTG